MVAEIYLAGKLVTFIMNSLEGEVDVDQLTSIDPSNLYGEAVTVPALLNQIGTLKAQSEKILSEKKLELDVFEADLRQRIRKEAATTGSKLTENAVNEMVIIDHGFQIKKKNMITANYNFELVESLWWGVKSKDMKLNNLIKGVTPEEFLNEIVEGKINNMTIKKHGSITDLRNK